MTKILVSIDDKLLEKVDLAARESGLSRSAFLSRLLEQIVTNREGPGRSAPVRRSLKSLDSLFRAHGTIGDPVATIREERDSH